MEQKPGIGRIVHLLTRRPDGSQKTEAAIITFVYPDDSIDLTSFGRAISAKPLQKIYEEGKNDPAASAFSWIWPPRV